VSTKFNPVMLEIEMVQHDIDSLYALQTNTQIRDLDKGVITTFDDDGNIIESMTDEQIEALDHWVILPSFFKYNLRYEIGDEFIPVVSGRQYPFTVAGFYNTGLSNESGMLFKIIISNEDYRLLTPVFQEYVFLAFNSDDDFNYRDYFTSCMDESGDSFEGYGFTKEEEKANETKFLNLFLYMSITLSLITFVASMVLLCLCFKSLYYEEDTPVHRHSVCAVHAYCHRGERHRYW
jgi:hypothetical protein